MSDKPVPYEVGFGKPPKSGQFKKGTSGNAKGRPKGSKNLAAEILRESRQLVRVNSSGGNRKISKVRATVMQLGNKSAMGDMRATREFLNLIARSEESLNASAPPTHTAEVDRNMQQSILDRMRKILNNNSSSQEENKK